jgi:hypothetical protein
MVSAVVPMNNQPWLAPIPIVGQYALMNDVLGGKMPPAYLFAVAMIATLGVALLLVSLTTRLLHRERIIFGR